MHLLQLAERRNLLVALLAALLFLTAAGQPASPSTLRDPVYGSGAQPNDTIDTRNFPDPSLLRVGRRLYAYSTSSTGASARNIAVMSSRDMHNWSTTSGGLLPTEALPNPPAWAWTLTEGGEFWAPTVGKFGTNYVMFFGARHRSTPASQPTWCIGVATATSPVGPFTGTSQPLFCSIDGDTVTTSPLQNNGAIDPQLFVDTDGTTYLHWKAENNHVQLWGIELSANGRSTVGAPSPMVPMDGFDTTAWEYSNRLGFTILENPAMDRDPATGTYMLYYSGGEWQNSGYSTGYATCVSPTGPCERVTVTAPWLISRGDRSGPGGLSLVKNATGQTFVAYHTWRSGQENTNEGRSMHLEPLIYSRGEPRLANTNPVGKVKRPKIVDRTVILRGWAYDRDAGEILTVRLVRDGQILDEAKAQRSRPRPSARTHPHAGARRGFDLRAPAEPGRYCVLALDDRSKRPKRIGCRNVS